MSLIAWVRQWIANIIALIFLATLLELLLPRGSLQRFVRVVMGLLVMLAVLQPVFSLMAQGFGLDALRVATDDRGIDIDRILADAERLREQNSNLALEAYRRQVESSMEQRLVRLPGVRSAVCRVELATDAARRDIGAIAAVTVTVTPGEATTTAGSATATVEPVKPVVIGQSSQPTAQSPPQLSEELRAMVVRTLAADFGLAPGQITVAAGGS